MSPDKLVGILLAIVDSQQFSDAQRYEIMGRFNSGILGGSASPPEISEPKHVAKVVVPATEKLEPGKVIIEAGHACSCEICEKLIYTVTNDITETMKVTAFIAAFESDKGVPKMTTDTDIWADPYGNLAVDCPLCKSRKTVWIKGIGDKLFSDYPENSAPPLSDK